MVVQTGTWEIEYFDRGINDFVSLRAEIDQVVDELGGDSSASFYLPNTNFNRDLVDNGVLVTVYFNGWLQYSGTLSAADVSSTKIKAVLLDTAILMLDEAEPVTGVYDQVPANEILVDVLSKTPGSGINLGACPTAEISVVFYKANRLDIVKFVADATGLEYWPTNGDTINIGLRGNNYWNCPERLFISRRGLDRSKIADKVIIRGVNQWGQHLTGEAGYSGWLGARVRVFNEDTPADQTTLQNIAAKKLVELQSDSTGTPISTLMTMGYQFGVGDFVNIYRPKYMLWGNWYRIVQMTKSKVKVSLQLDKPRQTVEKTLADLRNWEKNGIYLPGCTSWSINLQGLVGLYHLNEGNPSTVAKDSSPRDTPVDGTIVHGNWQMGPVCQMLTLAGDGYVDIGDSISFSATNAFSVGGWFSPSELNSTHRYLAHKDGQFSLGYIDNLLRFTFTASDLGVQTFDSDAGKVKAGARLFVIVTFDGQTVKMYINAQLHKSWSHPYPLNASTNKVYLGMFLQGAFAEMMLWTRPVVDQEVTELYFFPLNRVVQTATGGT
jgi:hypothetical protein